MHQFIYNGRSSADFGLILSGEDTWKKAVPELERTAIPGRNGDLLLSNRRYGNVSLTYHIGIQRGFPEKYGAFMNFLLKDPGYHRLEDSYHPENYRVAVMDAEVSPKVGAYHVSGTFDLTFSCKPQQYLKSGERRQILTGSGTVYNPTLFDARPLLRIYGTGQVIIGDVTVTVTECDEFTDVDCELEDAYKDSVNKNGCVILSGGEFPVLQPGTTGIIFGAGVTKIELIPRWWCL